MKIKIILLICSLLLGCTTDKVLRIRSLKSPNNPSVDPKSESYNRGNIIGLNALTSNATNTNIFLVHGMGWTQEQSHEKFGNNLVNAILNEYKGSEKIKDEECPVSTINTAPKTNSGLIINSTKLSPLSTDDPQLSIVPSPLGCLEKTVIKISQDKTITIYKFLWDDTMWDTIESKQIGYDDVLPPKIIGYDDVNKLRARYNGELKSSIVTYGFTDAALYMSPVGKTIREGVEASLCIALSNSYESYKNQTNYSEACSKQPNTKSPLLLVSHSLGSRIIFDTLKTDLSDKLAKQIENGTTNNSIEIHMFANQLPLLGIGRMGAERSKTIISGKEVNLIAYSEINDLLTYELVPYFEKMCYSRQGCNKQYSDNDPLYKQMQQNIGFDVVDVRLQFAPNLIKPYSGFKNPKIAHTGHLMSRSVLDIFFCGATDGKSNGHNGKCITK
ncbi:hypothetical protein [Acinetobacter modestus]|uniref:hypothetical protein n=1 Tax=Acinetobacter modestus TaxID=1776740 RepID=UPI001F4A19BB|nr:hypothetical protein [Acinetobacter modestus]MCH7334685.1 hypothetical protein [Acinetobacter modestus]